MVDLILLWVLNRMERHADETRNLNAPAPPQLLVVVVDVDVFVLISSLSVLESQLMVLLSVGRENLPFVADHEGRALVV